MFYKASGIWPGDAAAGSGLCWRGGSPRNLRPVGSNGRLLLAEIAPQIIVRRDDILQLSRCTFAHAARTG